MDFTKIYSKFTLGDQINLLNKLNKRISSNKEYLSKCRDLLGRSTIIPKSKVFTFLERIVNCRNRTVYPSDSHNVPSNDELKVIQQITLNLIQELKNREIYPYVVRIDKEIIDKYGTQYLKAIDDSNQSWTIEINQPLLIGSSIETDKPYYLFSKTNPIAIKPILLPRN